MSVTEGRNIHRAWKGVIELKKLGNKPRQGPEVRRATLKGPELRQKPSLLQVDVCTCFSYISQESNRFMQSSFFKAGRNPKGRAGRW